MFSVYISVGPWRGFHKVLDPPTCRLQLGWISICYVKADIEKLIADQLEELRYLDKVRPHIAHIEDRLLKMFEAADVAHKREEALQDRADSLDDEVTDLEDTCTNLERELASIQVDLSNILTYTRLR